MWPKKTDMAWSNIYWSTHSKLISLVLYLTWFCTHSVWTTVGTPLHYWEITKFSRTVPKAEWHFIWHTGQFMHKYEKHMSLLRSSILLTSYFNNETLFSLYGKGFRYTVMIEVTTEKSPG